MGDVCKLMLSDDQHRLAVERMKRIRDRRLERQNPGIMSSAPMPAARAPPRPTRSSRRPSSTGSIPKPICTRCSAASPITQSIASPNCCPGTSSWPGRFASPPDRATPSQAKRAVAVRTRLPFIIKWAKTCFGRHRPILLCNSCGCGAIRLFFRYGTYACRHCHRALYASQKKKSKPSKPKPGQDALESLSAHSFLRIM